MNKRKVLIILLIIIISSLFTWARPYEKVDTYTMDGKTYDIIYVDNKTFRDTLNNMSEKFDLDIPKYAFIIRGYYFCESFPMVNDCKIYIRDNIFSIFGLEQLIKHEIGHLNGETHKIFKLNYMNPLPFLRY